MCNPRQTIWMCFILTGVAELHSEERRARFHRAHQRGKVIHRTGLIFTAILCNPHFNFPSLIIAE